MTAGGPPVPPRAARRPLLPHGPTTGPTTTGRATGQTPYGSRPPLPLPPRRTAGRPPPRPRRAPRRRPETPPSPAPRSS
ncbi:hypothetical protein B9W61_20040 [Streptomyces sp. CS057]|nr:hypothetical protein B9W61_20040 [Streptomyces sp. CS057]